MPVERLIGCRNFSITFAHIHGVQDDLMEFNNGTVSISLSLMLSFHELGTLNSSYSSFNGSALTIGLSLENSLRVR